MSSAPASDVRLLLPAGIVAIGVLTWAVVAACTRNTPVAPIGEKVYAAQGCSLCHGSDGAGSSFGPTLRGKARFWTREALVEYLKAPVEYAAQDPRLAEQKERYSLPMRQFDKVPADELGAVADFVLRLP